MAELTTGSEVSQFAASLNLVKTEIANALDQAAVQLDAYSESGSADSLRLFLEEVQQIRGTFKILDFRAGERICEELAETGRAVKAQKVNEATLEAFTQAVVFLKRYVDFVANGEQVAPSLLVPTINLIRKQRQEKPLPEAYFFLVNLRPKLSMPEAVPGAGSFPYRRARQLYQLGLIGLMRNQGRRGPLQVMLRAVKRFEAASRGGAAWPFWYVTLAALEALSQDAYEMTPQRLALLGALDRQVRKIQDTEGKAFNEKMPDWLLKELLYLVALGEADTKDIERVQNDFHVGVGVKETQLADARNRLSGPDQSALDSLSEALQEELQSVKDLIDMLERTDTSESNFEELFTSLTRIADTLQIANLNEAAEQTRRLCTALKANGPEKMQSQMPAVADSIIRIEQEMRGITQSGLEQTALVDPVSLSEAKIAVLSESMTALTMIKRAIGSYIDSNGDKLHVKNIGKSLHDVAGSLIFLEKENIAEMLHQLEHFIAKRLIENPSTPAESQLESFADAITAIEYYLDSMIGQTTGAEDALKMARESLAALKD
ncbi:hypothetical protein [Bacterioplanoides sp.]|uniref:hypothetical protein n=1 Tax=Bacterioplanoides sp. TaxID=2066072 RepID=UPI003B5B99E1